MPGFEGLPTAPMTTSAKQVLSGGYSTILFPNVAPGQVKGTEEGGRGVSTRIFTEHAFCRSWDMHSFIIIPFLSMV